MVKTGFNWNRECPRFLADVTGHGRCDIVGFGIDGVWVAKSDGTGGFLSPERVSEGFAYNKGSWRVDQHVRLVGEVKGKELVATDTVVAAGRTPLPTGGRSVHRPGASSRSLLGTTVFGIRAPGDLVGFGDDGVWIALNNGNGTFGAVQSALANFGVNQSWRVDRDTRMLADLTGKGRDSIVGFGEEGVWIALNDGHGGFGTLQSLQFFPGFGFTQGWRLDHHPRFAADLNGTGRADLVGFGDDAVWVAFNDGQGNFIPPAQRVCDGLCFNQGWGAEQPRFAARLTQNRRADLVGFGNDGVWAAFNNGDRTFTPKFVLQDFFAFNRGWRVGRHPRFVADLTGKEQADLVGFGDDDVWIALNDGHGNFAPAQPANVHLCYNQGWRVETHPRLLADVTGSGLPDIVGFGADGVWVALNNGKGGFGPAQFVLNDFGSQSLTGIDHIFVLIMENRSFDHMLGLSGITGTDAVTGEPTPIQGLTGNESNALHDMVGNIVDEFKVRSGANDTMPIDPGHGFGQTLVQLAGNGADGAWKKNPGPYPPVGTTINNAGFVDQYAAELGEHDPGGDRSEIMRCFGPGELPVLQQLANEFVVCDQWFSSMPGPTWPNRMFAHAASSGGLDDSPSPGSIAGWELGPGSGFGFQNGTIYHALDRANLKYRLYSADEYPMVSGLKGISILSINSMEGLVHDLPKSDFDSIRYVHIEPYYAVFSDFQNGNSQHPIGSVSLGESFIKEVYEAIRNSPVWETSLLIITWDEHGGFYDHVNPPTAVPPGDPPDDASHNQNGFLFDRLGVRVPAIVISPRIPKNLVDHRTYDHASIPATIEELFGLEPLTDRDRYANSLTTLLTLMTPRTDTPTVVGPPLQTTATAARPRRAPPINEGDLFSFLATAVAQDVKVSSSEERAAIFRRVRGIQNHAEALAYMKHVQQKVAGLRGSRTPAGVLNKITDRA